MVVLPSSDATDRATPLEAMLELARCAGEEPLPVVLETVAQTIREVAGFDTVVVNIYRPAWDDYEVVIVVGSPDGREALEGTAASSATLDAPLLAASGSACRTSSSSPARPPSGRRSTTPSRPTSRARTTRAHGSPMTGCSFSCAMPMASRSAFSRWTNRSAAGARETTNCACCARSARTPSRHSRARDARSGRPKTRACSRSCSAFHRRCRRARPRSGCLRPRATRSCPISASSGSRPMGCATGSRSS